MKDKYVLNAGESIPGWSLVAIGLFCLVAEMVFIIVGSHDSIFPNNRPYHPDVGLAAITFGFAAGLSLLFGLGAAEAGIRGRNKVVWLCIGSALAWAAAIVVADQINWWICTSGCAPGPVSMRYWARADWAVNLLLVLFVAVMVLVSVSVPRKVRALLGLFGASGAVGILLKYFLGK